MLCALAPGAPAASAAEATIDFEALAPGTVVTSQFKDAGGVGQGVVLGTAPTGATAGAPAGVEMVGPGAAPSGTHVVSIAGCCKEFNAYGIWGRFPGGAKHMVKVTIGAEATSISSTARLVGIDAAGIDIPGVAASAVVPADGKVATALKIEDPQGRIAFFKIVYNTLAGPGQVGGIPPQHLIDDLGYDVANAPQAPDFGLVLDTAATFGAPLSVARGGTAKTPARIVVTRLAGSSGPLDFAASALPAGVSATFAPDDAANPTAVSVTISAAKTAGAVVGGSFSVTATPKSTSSAAGPRTIAVPFTVVENYDLSVAGIDVTQGVQEDGNLPGRPAGSLLPFLASYDGLPFAARKRSVARVFAVVAAPDKTTVAGVTVLLRGFRDGKPLPGPLYSTVTLGPPASSVSANIVTAGGRRATAAARFVLPPEWTEPGKVTLQASLMPPTVLFGGASECGSMACGANNSYTLSGVGFFDTGYINIAPIRFKVAGQGFPGFPDLFLRRFERLAPLADGGVRRADDWRAEYDVTALANAKTWTDALGFCPFAWPASLCGAVPNLDGLLLSRIVDFDSRESGCDDIWQPLRHAYCFDAVEGMIDDRTIGNPNGSAGISKGGRTIDGSGARAVANMRRPLTSVAHELGHGFGLKHASYGCGGGANGQKAVGWPDDWGTIQGLGLDTSDFAVVATGSAPSITPAPGAPSTAWYDYMSYCADNSQELANTGSPAKRVGNAWISTINWQAMFNTLRGLKRSSAASASASEGPAARAAGTRPATLIAHGFLVDGRVVLARVGPGGGTPSPATASPYRLVLRDGAGGTLGEAPMVVRSSEGHAKEIEFVGAEIAFPGARAGQLPAALKSIEVRDAAGTTIGGARRSAHRPTARLLGLRAGMRIGAGARTRVRWRAADADGDRLTATLEYSFDGGRGWKVLWSGPNRSSVLVPSGLLSASNNARLRLRVGDGFDEARAISPRLVAVGRPPQVRIVSPERRATLTSADRLALVAAATDDRSDPIAPRRVRWLDGRRVILRRARGSAAGLRPGLHRLTAVATDRRGRTGRASITVRVRAVTPRLIAHAVPERVAATARILRLRLAATERAELTASGASARRAGRLGTLTPRPRVVRISIRPGSGPVSLVLRVRAYGRRSTIRLTLPRD